METENSPTYMVKTASYEGPFGLLLGLVEKRKLFINDVSLAQVTEDYLNHINQLRADTSKYAGEISSFVIVAATLILIKSKSLLPNLDLTNEEEGDIHALEERLRLYKIFTELGNKVKNGFGQKIIFAPQDRKIDTLVFLPDEQITRESMMTLARNAVEALPKKVVLPKVDVKKVISIEEMINRLAERIQTSIKMSFRQFAGVGKSVTREEKVTVIVGFLAMLEMVRNGILHVVQESHADDIIIEKKEAETKE